MQSTLSGDYLSIGLVLYAVLVVFLAGAVRGYTGFGFSALVLLSLSLILPPALVVPVLLLLEVTASIHMMPAVWRQIDRRTLTWLLLGSAISVPMGMYLLASLPEAQMRVIISLVVLATTVLLWRGYRFRAGGGRLAFTTGLVSGAMAGAAGVGGLIVVVMFLSVSAPVRVVRATMVAFLLLSCLFTLGVAGAYSLVNTDVFLAAGILLLPLFAGVSVGRHIFNITTPETFQRFVLIILTVLSLAGIGRALAG